MVGYSNGCFQDGRYDTSVIGQFKSLYVFPKAGKSFPTRLASRSKPGTFHQNDLRFTYGITIEHGILY